MRRAIPGQHRVSQRVTALEQRQSEPWTLILPYTGAVADGRYQNSWANETGRDGAFFRDVLGMVHMDGQCQTGASGTTIVVLPALYRPVRPVEIVAHSYNGAPGYGTLHISTAGVVSYTWGAGGGNRYVQLRVSFRAA